MIRWQPCSVRIENLVLEVGTLRTKDVQPSKASSKMCVTESGRVKFAKEVQLVKT